MTTQLTVNNLFVEVPKLDELIQSKLGDFRRQGFGLVVCRISLKRDNIFGDRTWSYGVYIITLENGQWKAEGVRLNKPPVTEENFRNYNEVVKEALSETIRFATSFNQGSGEFRNVWFSYDPYPDE